ncbi:hypothetical protein B0H63DRAFT_17901 [Podospora didyma]|uniref:Integral membrane protein n=1 Tax=Podospora didyma TaxID=330526 RepID=A0AAE0U7I0_9PEZI|nr:hypothetical protein B0H63DRAFT_17901 [Podospora didyma]
METTLMPFAALPSCAVNCGPLYDANGACAPAGSNNGAAAIQSCFCANSKVSAFSAGVDGVCNAVCTAQADLSSIQGWFTSFCNNKAAAAPTTTSTTSSKGLTGGSTNGNTSGGGGGTWLSGHYQWVIFLVIMIVAIVGIWVGACVWRRRYQRRKDRQYALGANLARATESGRVVPNASQAGSIHVPGAGMFSPAPITEAGIYDVEKPKKGKKKWTVRERT